MNSEGAFSEVAFKYSHGLAFVIKTFKKNVTLDVFRNGVMSLLCFKETKHFKTNKLILPNDNLIAMVNHNRSIDFMI